ncbi:MAG: alkaline phosphatase family protein [Chloroflexota bacterium]|nr:alkaline phosphatase family protein [Chloroflexota bacterium]
MSVTSRRLVRAAVVTLVIVASLRSGGSSALAVGPCGTASAAPRVYQHVIWIWMENHTYGEVIDAVGAPAPYTTGLAHQCGTATNYAIVGSPSLPNYIGATAGSTFGIADDNRPSSHVLTADNLFRQVRAAGLTEKSYQESMPANCRLTDSYPYAVKHNPAAYFTGGSDRTACMADDVPMGTTASGIFLDDLNNSTLPNFAFITPNLCSDTHDCAVSVGDAWLADWMPHILNSASYLSGNTAVIIMYDEYTPMPNVFITPATAPGTVSAVAFNHYSLLRATEEMLGITTYLGGAATAPGMRSVFEPQLSPSVGGITEPPEATDLPSAAATPESRTIWYLAGASVLAAVAVAGAAAWYARRARS